MDKGQQVYWENLFACLFLAGLSYALYQRNRGERSFVSFFLPLSTLKHPSFLVDLKILAVYRILLNIPQRIFFSTTAAIVAIFIAFQIVELTGIRGMKVEVGWGATIVFLLIVGTVIKEFVYYWIHRTMHFNRVLWPFHRLHHSAEVLSPFTLLRKHPIEGVIMRTGVNLATAVYQGVLFFVFFGDVKVLTLLGISSIRGLYNIAGSALRHSHIWISYGPKVSKILISPAQHQIHHSVAPEHVNKNFGEILAIWDWMFGTLYVPPSYQKLRFGHEAGAPQIHNTLVEAYVEPIVSSWKALVKPDPAVVAPPRRKKQRKRR